MGNIEQVGLPLNLGFLTNMYAISLNLCSALWRIGSMLCREFFIKRAVYLAIFAMLSAK